MFDVFKRAKLKAIAIKAFQLALANVHFCRLAFSRVENGRILVDVNVEDVLLYGLKFNSAYSKNDSLANEREKYLPSSF